MLFWQWHIFKYCCQRQLFVLSLFLWIWFFQATFFQSVLMLLSYTCLFEFSVFIVAHCYGCSQDFFYRGEGNFGAKGWSPRPKSGGGVLGERAVSPSHQLGGLWCAVSSPAVSGAQPQSPNGFHAFHVFRVASPGSLVLFIVSCKGRIFPYALHLEIKNLSPNRCDWGHVTILKFWALYILGMVKDRNFI